MQVAACGTPVLLHDDTLDRTSSGGGPVEALTVDQLRRLDAGSWFGSEFRGERIPTFGEALEELRPSSAVVYAEVKGYRQVEDLDLMARIAMDMAMSERLVFISLDFGIVDRLAEQDPRARMGYVLDRHHQFQGAVRKARAMGGRGLVDLKYTMILEDPLLVPRARAQKVDLAVWTVNRVDEAAALYEAGVRRFTTNEVSDLVAWSRSPGSGGSSSTPAGG